MSNDPEDEQSSVSSTASTPDEPTPQEQPDALDAFVPKVRPKDYDASRGDPLQYRGALRRWFAQDVAGAQHVQNQQDAFDRVTQRQQRLETEKAERKRLADQKAAAIQSRKDDNS